MKIIIVSHYFWPEPFIINDLVHHLSKNGHKITVLTGKPNYPDGQVYDGYQAEGLQHEYFHQYIDVFRVPLHSRGSASSIDLVRNYLSFVWSGLRYFPRIIKNRDVDAILVFAPSPITSAIPAIFLKWMKKAHLAVWIQDLWPESLAATGHIRNPFLLCLVSVLVKIIYRFSDTLLIQSQAFYEPVRKMASSEKIVYYPNSIDTAIATTDNNDPLCPDLLELLESNFCLVFAGNIGKAQAVEMIIEAAKRLKDFLNFKLVLVGSGSMLDWVKEQKTLHALDNLVLAGRYPMNLMPQIYKHASGLLVTLKDDEIFSYTIPSKVQTYLAAGKPIIASLNGEGARIINEAGAGLSCPAEDVEVLVDCIKQLYKMPLEQRQQMGQRGYAYFMKHYEMSGQAKRLVEILIDRVASSGGLH